MTASINQTVRSDFRLEVGQLAQTVTVQAEVLAIEPMLLPWIPVLGELLEFLLLDGDAVCTEGDELKK